MLLCGGLSDTFLYKKNGHPMDDRSLFLMKLFLNLRWQEVLAHCMCGWRAPGSLCRERDRCRR